MAQVLRVFAEWVNLESARDPEEGVWVARSEDVPGLVAEAATPGELADKLGVLVPELLEANAHLLGEVVQSPRVRICFGGFERSLHLA